MKKTISIILSAIIILSLAGCGNGGEKESYKTNGTDKYTYEQKEEIQEHISTILSQYGYNYSVYASEKDSKMHISVYLNRASNGTEETFVDTVDWSISAVESTLSEYDFELEELEIAFSLYNGSLKGDPSGAITYKTTDLKTGDLVYAIDSDVRTKQDATPQEIRDYLCAE